MCISELCVVPPEVVDALRDAFNGSDVVSGYSGARLLRPVSLVLIVEPVDPLPLVVMPFWEEACLRTTPPLSRGKTTLIARPLTSSTLQRREQ